jgi:hypothetical protein
VTSRNAVLVAKHPSRHLLHTQRPDILAVAHRTSDLSRYTSGHAERLAAQHLIEPHAERARRITVGADKGFDTQDFVAEMREINVTPHVAQNDNGRRSAIDGRITRHRLAVHLRDGRLQPRPSAQAVRGDGMTPALRPQPPTPTKTARATVLAASGRQGSRNRQRPEPASPLFSSLLSRRVF